jgi:hypothetical protein
MAAGGAGRDRFGASQGSFDIADFAQGQDEILLSGATSVTALDPGHLAYVAAGVTYRIGLSGLDATKLTIGHAAGGDVVF